MNKLKSILSKIFRISDYGIVVFNCFVLSFTSKLKKHQSRQQAFDKIRYAYYVFIRFIFSTDKELLYYVENEQNLRLHNICEELNEILPYVNTIHLTKILNSLKNENFIDYQIKTKHIKCTYEKEIKSLIFYTFYARVLAKDVEITIDDIKHIRDLSHINMNTEKDLNVLEF